MEKTVKKGAVMEEKITEIFINGKNTVAMSNIDQFKRHIGSAFHGIFVTTSGTKAAVTTGRDKFKIATMGADIHSSAKGRIATAQHLIDIFHLSLSGMKGIFYFFIIVGKDSL